MWWLWAALSVAQAQETPVVGGFLVTYTHWHSTFDATGEAPRVGDYRSWPGMGLAMYAPGVFAKMDSGLIGEMMKAMGSIARTYEEPEEGLNNLVDGFLIPRLEIGPAIPVPYGMIGVGLDLNCMGYAKSTKAGAGWEGPMFVIDFGPTFQYAFIAGDDDGWRAAVNPFAAIRWTLDGGETEKGIDGHIVDFGLDTTVMSGPFGLRLLVDRQIRTLNNPLDGSDYVIRATKVQAAIVIVPGD